MYWSLGSCRTNDQANTGCIENRAILDKLADQDKRFDSVEKRLDSHDRRFDAVTEILLDHSDRFDQLQRLVRKDKKDLLTALDQQTVILQRLDQERVFTNEWIKRLEAEVKQHEKEITRMKRALKLS